MKCVRKQFITTAGRGNHLGIKFLLNFSALHPQKIHHNSNSQNVARSMNELLLRSTQIN